MYILSQFVSQFETRGNNPTSLLDRFSFTYISDRNTKQTFSGVVGLSHCLALLKLLARTPHLVGHLMGMINVCMARKPSNQHL